MKSYRRKWFGSMSSWSRTRCELPTLRPATSSRGGRALVAHWTRGWLATTAALDSAKKRMISSLVGIDSNFLRCKGPAGLFLTKGLRYRKSKDVVLFEVSVNVFAELVAIQHHKSGGGGGGLQFSLRPFVGGLFGGFFLPRNVVGG